MFNPKKETYFVCDARELEKIVEDTFNMKEYSFVSEEECGNGVQRVYDTEIKYAWQQDEIDKVNKGNFNYNPSIIMRILAKRGLIPHGKYLVDMSW